MTATEKACAVCGCSAPGRLGPLFKSPNTGLDDTCHVCDDAFRSRHAYMSELYPRTHAEARRLLDALSIYLAEKKAEAQAAQPVTSGMRDFQGEELVVGDIVIISYFEKLCLARLVKVDEFDKRVGTVEHFVAKNGKTVSREFDVSESEISKASETAATKFNLEFPTQVTGLVQII